jgi:hypothetical protein
MVQRCTYTKHRHYARYGGRGITICERWQKFENFLADMGERPTGLCLERIDNDKGYCPENCKWTTQTAQNRNRAGYNVTLTAFGETLCASEWAAKYGMSVQALLRRLRAGWPVEKAISAPLDKRWLRKSAA